MGNLRPKTEPTYLVSMSLDIEPEHHHSRLARSTCCQRPFRSRLGGRFGLTDGRGTSPLPSVLESFKHTPITERCQPSAAEFFINSTAGSASNARGMRSPGRRGQFGAQYAGERLNIFLKDQVEVLRPFENLVPEWKPRLGPN